ncbi:hypothetical protein XELAEV_18020305mg [Xenopus laevis]|uniref:Uncharacterized protein n=1 Tax=Xenopus laevis TaxID=8355 RepID=A0A974D7I2_XENLA|nr:hypothetical protein XELAEV_18020305mg [Xenopus laevis]
MDFQRGSNSVSLYSYTYAQCQLVLELDCQLFCTVTKSQTSTRCIWSAALDGDLNKVRYFIHKGRDPSLPDNFSYTALLGGMSS